MSIEDRAVEYSAFRKSGAFSVPPPPPRSLRERLGLACALVAVAGVVGVLGYRVTLSALGPATSVRAAAVRAIALPPVSTPQAQVSAAPQPTAAVAPAQPAKTGAVSPTPAPALVQPKVVAKPKAQDPALDFDLMDAARMREELATHARAQPDAARARNVKARPWPLRASASLESVSVDGKLSVPALGQTLSGALRRFEACYEQAASRSNRNRFGTVQLELRVGAAGQLRTSSVQSTELVGLDACMNEVTQTLVTKAPDPGTTYATARIRFAP